MSYTLSGRLQTRAAVLLAPLLAACALALALHDWWPVQLAALMAGAGVLVDLAVHRPLRYQPGWAALPLGLAELALVMGAALALSLGAPPGGALALFGGAWLLGQALVHAVLPRRRLTWGEDGGELGRAGAALAAAALGVLLAAGATARALEPPTVHLSAGVHEGPLVIDRSETLDADPGAIVHGGLVIRADDVTVRDLTVTGGENGIVVEGARDVRLDGVRVLGAHMDGIHVRRSSVAIEDCVVTTMRGEYTQAIDLSFNMEQPPSSVEGCTIDGGREGIVTHSTDVMVAHNHVSGTRLRGIAIVEMSMGMVEENDVDDALGIGIFCSDRSMCEIERNRIAGTRADLPSQDLARMGHGIVAQFRATAHLTDNALPGSRPPAAFGDATIERG